MRALMIALLLTAFAISGAAHAQPMTAPPACGVLEAAANQHLSLPLSEADGAIADEIALTSLYSAPVNCGANLFDASGVEGLVVSGYGFSADGNHARLRAHMTLIGLYTCLYARDGNAWQALGCRQDAIA